MLIGLSCKCNGLDDNRIHSTLCYPIHKWDSDVSGTLDSAQWCPSYWVLTVIWFLAVKCWALQECQATTISQSLIRSQSEIESGQGLRSTNSLLTVKCWALQKCQATTISQSLIRSQSEIESGQGLRNTNSLLTHTWNVLMFWLPDLQEAHYLHIIVCTTKVVWSPPVHVDLFHNPFFQKAQDHILMPLNYHYVQDPCESYASVSGTPPKRSPQTTKRRRSSEDQSSECVRIPSGSNISASVHLICVLPTDQDYLPLIFRLASWTGHSDVYLWEWSSCRADTKRWLSTPIALPNPLYALALLSKPAIKALLSTLFQVLKLQAHLNEV